MTVDSGGNSIKYDGDFILRASFFCFEKDDHVFLEADPVADSDRIKFRSERCPFCGNNHWRSKEYYKKYE